MRYLCRTLLLCLATGLTGTVTHAADPSTTQPLAAEVLAAIRESGVPSKSFGFYALPVDKDIADAGAVLASLNAEQTFFLASTAKVVTSLAALDLLGFKYAWPMRASALSNVKRGQLSGDLLIAGNHRVVTPDELRRWFKQMRGQGLQHIDGRIVIDHLALDLPESTATALASQSQEGGKADGGSAEVNAASKAGAAGARHAGSRSLVVGKPDVVIRRAGRAVHQTITPLVASMSDDARAFNEGSMTLSVEPGTGDRATITLNPMPQSVMVVNEVLMGDTCNAWAHWSNDPNAIPGSPAKLLVSGRWKADCPKEYVAYVRPLPGMKFAPNVVLPGAGGAAATGHGSGHGNGMGNSTERGDSEMTQRAVASLWAEVGGTLSGSVVDAPEPAKPVKGVRAAVSRWKSVFATPLAEVIREINKTSDNLAARGLLLSLATGNPSAAQIRQNAKDRVHAWLRGQGLVDGDLRIELGSGQSREERGKPRAMVQLLRNAWRSEGAQAFVNSLPIAGVDGTLVNRMRGSAAAGQAFLKTGTLSDTRALAGYVRGHSGKVYAVTAIVNHPDAARARPALDAFINWVAKNG